MKRLQIIALGLLSVVPFIYVFVFMAFVIHSIAATQTELTDSDWFYRVFILHAAIMLLSVILAGYFAYDLWDNPQIAHDKKPMWLVLILLFGLVAWPTYWYTYKWKDLKSH